MDKDKCFAIARSNIRNTSMRLSHEIGTLIADPSFDVWSLGCVLYQLCTPGTSILKTNSHQYLKANSHQFSLLDRNY